jgi:hypothetical protein
MLLAICPDTAELLAVVTPSKNVLDFASLSSDCNVPDLIK